jgi:hypothetical protein
VNEKGILKVATGSVHPRKFWLGNAYLHTWGILPPEAQGVTTGSTDMEFGSKPGERRGFLREDPPSSPAGQEREPFDMIPDPPDRIEFSCPCGKILSAPRQAFDRRSKCGACNTVLLLNLVYKRDLDRFEIEPFRIGGAIGA